MLIVVVVAVITEVKERVVVRLVIAMLVFVIIAPLVICASIQLTTRQEGQIVIGLVFKQETYTRSEQEEKVLVQLIWTCYPARNSSIE